MRLQIEQLGKVSVTVEEGYWDINKDYDKLTIVQKEGIFGTYISRKPVPAGIELTNRTYWIPFSSLKEDIVLDYNAFINRYKDILEQLNLKLNNHEDRIKAIESIQALVNRLIEKAEAGINEAKQVLGVANDALCTSNRALDTANESLRAAKSVREEALLAADTATKASQKAEQVADTARCVLNQANKAKELANEALTLANQASQNANMAVNTSNKALAKVKCYIKHAQELQDFLDETHDKIVEQNEEIQAALKDTHDLHNHVRDELSKVNETVTTINNSIILINNDIADITNDLETYKNKLDGLTEAVDTLLNSNPTQAIENFNEIIKFLENIEDTQSLSAIIAGIEQQIADAEKKIQANTEAIENIDFTPYVKFTDLATNAKTGVVSPAQNKLINTPKVYNGYVDKVNGADQKEHVRVVLRIRRIDNMSSSGIGETSQILVLPNANIDNTGCMTAEMYNKLDAVDENATADRALTEDEINEICI